MVVVYNHTFAERCAVFCADFYDFPCAAPKYMGSKIGHIKMVL